MNCSYYTNIQNRREAIKEAVAVLLEHEPFQDIEEEKLFLSTCAYENSKELVEVIFEVCSDLPELHILRTVWTTEELDRRFEEEIVKQFGDVETYKEHLIKLSEGNECIQDILTEEYYNFKELALKGCKWAFDREVDYCYGSYQYLSAENIEFCLECEKVGVDTEIDSALNESIEACNEEVINILASLKAYKYLEEQDLCTYEWVKDSLSGEDKVAEIASQHLYSVIRYKEDLEWLKKEAATEVPQAQYLMALLYLPNDLDIVSENKSLAVRYLQAAKEGGCTLAEAELRKLGPAASTVFEDEKELLAKANKGNKGAMFELGNHYAFEGNDAEAKKWWNKASRKGHTSAKRSKKKGRLKKQPMSCSAAFLIAIVITIIALIVIGFTWGMGAVLRTISGLFLVVVVGLFLILK